MDKLNKNDNNKIRAEFAKRFKSFRKLSGWTQKQLSDVTEIHPVLIGRYERGETLPRKDNLLKLAKAFNVSVKDLDVMEGRTDTAAQKEIAAYLAKFDINALFCDTEEKRKKAGLKENEKDLALLTAPKEDMPFSYLIFKKDIDTIQEAIIIAESETDNFFKNSQHEYLKKRLLYHLLIKTAINNLPFYEQKQPEIAEELKAYLKITKD